jgi:2-polyprenyl-3-methyl-5-hydroxy-6-metoxy-1,4-benzoquinol methylase
MGVGEFALYQLARVFYRTEVAHSNSMKNALVSQHVCDEYRRDEVGRVLNAAARFGISLTGVDVLDLGCNDGALTRQYLAEHPRSLIGIDVDEAAVQRARVSYSASPVDFRVSSTTGLPVEPASIDLILCYDVFEHVSNPDAILAECKRVLRPGGRMLIGTWGWFHPFAPHLWSTMPVPWAHVLVSERTLLRACRRVYHAPWYVPTFHDFDENGNRKPDKYMEESLSTDYLNKFRVSQFEQAFARSGLRWQVHLQPFGAAPWSGVLLRVPFLREFVHGYLWAVLTRPS